ncbi:MAG: flagellar hook basal-body protein [Verrucomicrobiales bacterium]|jgi:flagellar basal-body rod protein FlgF|nr:flagellar hook basal-body protein [Verrucomicrobiales bacterium]
MNVGLYQSASALNANARWQEAIAENLASSSVPGFRKQDLTFGAVEAGMLGDFTVRNPQGPQHFSIPNSQNVTNFRPGELRFTGQTTDIGIQGNGFFEVQLPDGSSAFTRSGEFAVNPQGQLVTKQGYAVLGDAGPIQLDPRNSAPISVSPTGEISQGVDMKGKLKLTEFDVPSKLTSLNGELFVADDPALNATPSTTGSVRQGWLESANTSAVAEMANLLAAMRSFEANQRAVQIQDERMSKIINTVESN